MIYSTKSILVLATILISSFLIGAFARKQGDGLMYKSLNGPADEFPMHVLPTTESGAQDTSSAFIPVHFTPASSSAANTNAATQTVQWQHNLAVDSDELFMVSVFSPIEDDLKIEFQLPSSNQFVEIKKVSTVEPVKGWFGMGDNRVPDITYQFDKPQVGTWVMRITTTAASLQAQLAAAPKTLKDPSNAPHAFVLMFNKSPFQAYAHLNTYHLTTGQKIGLVGMLYTNSEFSTEAGVAGVRPQGVRPTPVKFNSKAGVQETVTMDIILPDGSEQKVPMHDDGINGDSVASDGVYSATIDATEVGQYKARMVMEGVDPSGLPLIRTTQHLIQVLDYDVTFNGQVTAVQTSQSNLQLDFHINWINKKPSQDDTFKAYAEVWGVDAAGNSIPIAWVAGMTDAIPVSNTEFILPLNLNLNWVARVQAKAPFTVKNVYVQDREHSVPLSQLAQASVVINSALHIDYVAAAALGDTITEEMQMGPRPQNIPAPGLAAAGGKLILVHGYCTDRTPFDVNHFTDYVVFGDFKQSRTNDVFARLIIDFAKDLPSFGIAAHSQGGLAALHLFTFYWSGADSAAGKRFIQTVGSPYSGSSLAGSIANLGDVFGLGCGENTDLTRDGAPLWQATIPTAARKQVYYWTTQYKPLSWCNLASNLVLAWPNDGVAEKEYSQLSGANNMGHKEKWCHSRDMNYPAQCTDASRNSEINANAFR